MAAAAVLHLIKSVAHRRQRGHSISGSSSSSSSSSSSCNEPGGVRDRARTLPMIHQDQQLDGRSKAKLRGAWVSVCKHAHAG
jgi:hypothetical protein